MSEVTTENIDTAISRIADGGVSGFSVNGESAQTLPIKDLLELRREIKQEELDASGEGNCIIGADFRG